MASLEIVRIPALTDNYIWLLHDPDSGETVAVDPAEAAPVLAELARRGWSLTAIWNTHWHGDHIGGNAELKAATGCTVIAPKGEAEKIPTADRLVGEGEEVRIGGHGARVAEMPGHTAGHIVYHLAEGGLIFTGDTLFAMGCGRLFEGTAAQMYANMQRLAALPPSTQVYCAHEYTEANGRFALVVEPDNGAIRERMAEVARLRAAGEATVPTSIALERATNPFLRADSLEQFTARRTAKDEFRG